MSDHIGELIATLLDYSPNPDATLAFALAARRTACGTLSQPARESGE